MKMLFVCEGKLEKDFSKEAVIMIDKTPYIDSIYQLRDNFEKNGVLLLNMALVFTTKEDSKNIKTEESKYIFVSEITKPQKKQ